MLAYLAERLPTSWCAWPTSRGRGSGARCDRAATAAWKGC